jgi:hypothetical protein
MIANTGPRFFRSFRNNFFYGEGLLTPRPTPKLEGHPLLSVHDCLFNIFAANLHCWRLDSCLYIHFRFPRKSFVSLACLVAQFSFLMIRVPFISVLYYNYPIAYRNSVTPLDSASNWILLSEREFFCVVCILCLISRNGSSKCFVSSSLPCLAMEVLRLFCVIYPLDIETWNGVVAIFFHSALCVLFLFTVLLLLGADCRDLLPDDPPSSSPTVTAPRVAPPRNWS